MVFKIVISDPKTRRAYQKEVEKQASGLIGKKIGDTFSGNVLGLSGYEFQITGGSDKEGFPMRRDVEGTARKKILLSSGPGFHPKRKGQRKRKSIRGNTISTAISQINVKVVKYGDKPLEKIFGVKEEKAEKEATEKKPEEKTEEKKKEAETKEKPEPEKKEEAKPEETQKKTETKEVKSEDTEKNVGSEEKKSEEAQKKSEKTEESQTKEKTEKA